jgi:hypothetical protein
MSRIFGTVDGFKAPNRVFGWVTSEPTATAEKLGVAVELNGKVVGKSVANQFRQDLTPFSDGFIAYDISLSTEVTITDFAIARVAIRASNSDGENMVLDIGQVFAREILISQISRCITPLSGAVSILSENELERAISDALVVADDRWQLPLRDLLMAFRLEPLPSAPNTKAMSATSHCELRAAIGTLEKFESLGYNCEFGLVQRHFGVENIGLLRWGASWGGLAGFMKGLRARFENAGTAVSYHMLGEEYISQDSIYDIVFHTDRYRGQIDPETLLRNERLRISYLARNFIENIEDGAKIFVYKAECEPEISEMVELLACLREIGPVNLLWVSVAQCPNEVGKVEQLGRHFFRGRIDRFSPPEHIHSFCSYGVWLEICRKCLQLVEEALLLDKVE